MTLFRNSGLQWKLGRDWFCSWTVIPTSPWTLGASSPVIL